MVQKQQEETKEKLISISEVTEKFKLLFEKGEENNRRHTGDIVTLKSLIHDFA